MTSIREELKNDVKKKLINQKKDLMNLTSRRRLVSAFIEVCKDRVSQGRWLPTTAWTEMKKSSGWMEYIAPTSTSLPTWRHAMKAFQKFPHKTNKAPLLSWMELVRLADSCVSQRHRAIFWLGVMTCSRIGNLDGLEIEEITEEYARTILVRHKTAAKVNQMSITLPYWNVVMKEQIVGFIKPGKITHQEMTEIERSLELNATRKHSIRRTSCNVYIDCMVPIERIMAITRHTTQEALLGYVGNINPIRSTSAPTGMAISHAPNMESLKYREGAYEGGWDRPIGWERCGAL